MQSFYDIKSDDLSILGKLDTPIEIYEKLLLGKKRLDDKKWRGERIHKFNKEFKKLNKNFFSEEDTRKFLNDKIQLLCDAAVMVPDQEFLEGPAKYYYNVKISYHPEKEGSKIISGIAAKLKIKKSTSSLSVHSETKKFFLECWDDTIFKKNYEQLFKEFYYAWKTKCKEIIQNLESPEASKEETLIYSRLRWVFKKLIELEETPVLKDTIPESTSNIINLFKSFIQKNTHKKKVRGISFISIDPEECIQRVRCALLNENIDTALDRYHLVKKLMQLEQIIAIPSSAETYGLIDPIIFHKVKLGMLQCQRRVKLQEMKKYSDLKEFKKKAFSNSGDGDLKETKKTAFSDSGDAEESDMETKTGDSAFSSPRDSEYSNPTPRSHDSGRSISTDSESLVYREQEEEESHSKFYFILSKETFEERMQTIEERMPWLDVYLCTKKTKGNLSNEDENPALPQRKYRSDTVPLPSQKRSSKNLTPRSPKSAVIIEGPSTEKKRSKSQSHQIKTILSKSYKLKNLKNMTSKSQETRLISYTSMPASKLREEKGKEKEKRKSVSSERSSSSSSSSEKEKNDYDSDSGRDKIKRK